MPNYTFELRDGSDGIGDGIGIDLPDRDRAYEYAREVVRELMGQREAQTRFWCLDVYENDRERIFQIPFASVDETLNHCTPQWRALIADACGRLRAAKEVHHAARQTVRESRALVARSRGKPYLATEAGRRTVRD
jgi:hypothetical protein